MNCRQVMHRISAYADGELTGVEMLEIRRHMMDCVSCREEYDSTRETKAMLSRLRTVHPSAEFTARLMANLDVVQVPAYQRAWNSLSGMLRQRLSPVATAFVAVSVALVILSASSIDEMSPSRRDAVAQVPPAELHSIAALHTEIVPASNDNPFNSATPVSFSTAPAARFVNASFEPQ